MSLSVTGLVIGRTSLSSERDISAATVAAAVFLLPQQWSVPNSYCQDKAQGPSGHVSQPEQKVVVIY